MGAWAADAFGNDTALDWVGSLGRARSWAPVEKALKVAVTGDASAAEVALAAAEVVAAGRGFPADELPEEAEGFVAKVGAPPEALLATAQRRLDEVTAEGSELRALWVDGPSGEAWIEATDDLRRRLAGLPAPPRPEEPPGPLVPWSSPAVQDWIADLYLGEDWTPAGRALGAAEPVDATPKGPVRHRGLAAVEAVCAVLGRPAAEVPAEIAEAVARLGMPDTWVIDRACFVATRLAARDAKRRGGVLPAPWIDLLARLRGCDAETVVRDPEGWHPAAGSHEHPRAILRGRRRKEPAAAGDVVALRYPQGWVVGRVVPARTYWSGASWVWLYEGFRPAPDDLDGASFERRWAGPRLVDRAVFREGWLELQDPALRSVDDGAGALDHADPLPYGANLPVPREAYPRYLNAVAEDAGQLDDEIRYRSGVGFRELVETKVRHALLHGVRQQLPGDLPHPGYLWRYHLFFADRALIEALAREIRDAIPREEVDRMRRAWVTVAESAGRSRR